MKKTSKRRFLCLFNLIILVSLLSLISACGGGGGGGDTAEDLTYTLTVSTTPGLDTFQAGETVTITATVTGSDGLPASGYAVTFTVYRNNSGGTLTIAGTGATDGDGRAQATYTPGSNAADQTVADTIEISIPGSSETLTINRAASTYSLVVSANRTNLAAGETAILTATLTDNNGPVSGQAVDFVVSSNNSSGTLTIVGTGTTDTNGQAVANYKAGEANPLLQLDDTITVSVLSISQTVTITRLVGSSEEAASLDISIEPTSIKTDNSNSATITVNALTAGNALLPGVKVNLSTDNGILSAPSVTTPGTVTLFSGSSNKANRTATITATTGTLDPVQRMVQIVGSTVTVTSSATSISISGSTTLTVTVKDAGGNAITNADISLSQSGIGTVTFDAETGTTNASGIFTTKAHGSGAGDVTITADWLGTKGTTNVTVTPVGAAFGIENQYLDGSVTPIPDNPDSTSLTINNSSTPDTPHSLKIVVNAAGIGTVRFASTIGRWNSSASKVIDVPVGTTGDGAGKVSATLTSTNIGLANVLVSDASDGNPSDTLTVAMVSGEPPAKIILQSSSTAVSPTVGTTVGTATLTATVYDASNNPLVNQPVAFEIVDGTSTSGGETVSPTMAMTNAAGWANATFYSGSMPSSGSGVNIRASVVGTVVKTEPIGVNVTDSGNDVAIVIGGTAGSIAFGKDSEAGEDSTSGNYTFKMSVLVADANGNPVPGAVVNLGAWPIAWSDGTGCVPDHFYLNEDNTVETSKENTILDPEEDGHRIDFDLYSPGTGYAGTDHGVVGSTDSRLTPVNSAGGTVPAFVTTDKNGVAGFTLTYPKTSGMWIYDRIRATTLVQGTETRAETIEYLKIVIGEEVICAESPFKY